jgi:hypothetical protein
MQRLEVSAAELYIYIYVVRRQTVKVDQRCDNTRLLTIHVAHIAFVVIHGERKVSVDLWRTLVVVSAMTYANFNVA